MAQFPSSHHPQDVALAKPRQSRWKAKFQNRTKLLIGIWLLMAPTVVGMLVFNYYPKFDAIWYSFFEWDGLTYEEYIGGANYKEVWLSDDFWSAFNLVMILFAANLVKMWPSIFAAVVLHRLRNDGMRYFYQVLFVIPMVIPGLVWLLIWKSFYNPNDGLLNHFLNMTGIMSVLHWLDTAWPAVSQTVMPVRSAALDYPFGNPFGLIIMGSCVLLALGGFKSIRYRWFAWVLAIIFGAWLVRGAGAPGATTAGPGVEPANWSPVWDMIMANRWWILIALGATVGFALSFGGAKPMHIAHDPGRTPRAVGKWIGWTCIIAGGLLVAMTMFWTSELGAFETGSPAWLGNPKLIPPAIIFWGFPWIGTVGVLLYLAALQGISTDVYEAAELDGVGPWGKLWHIELPLMLTMVRINLIFMTIGTLNDYGLFYILLGSGGGPNGAGDVPGLVMFRTAFDNVEFGLACAMGMYLFVMILLLTVIYQMYFRVEK